MHTVPVRFALAYLADNLCAALDPLPRLRAGVHFGGSPRPDAEWKRHQARSWLLGRRDAGGSLSLARVCAVLKLRPAVVRARVRRALEIAEERRPSPRRGRPPTHRWRAA